MTRTLVALVRDHPAILNRAVSLIRRRGYTIDKLVVGRTEHVGISRVTVAVDAANIDHAIEQLRRLIGVLTVREVPNESAEDWSDASAAWGACSMPESYHWQADGADNDVQD